MSNIKQAFEYAAANPNSEFANNLKQLAGSGSLDQEAQKYGIDLTAFKPKTTTSYDTGISGAFTQPGELANKIGERVSSIGTDIKEQASNFNKTTNPIEAVKAVARGVLRPVGEVAGGALDVVGAGFEALDNATGQVASTAGKSALTAILNTSAGQQGIAKAQEGAESYNAWKTSNPELAKDLEAVINIGNIIPVGKAIGTVGKGAVKGVEMGAEAVGKGAGKVAETVGSTAGAIKSSVPNLGVNSESIMQNVARVSKAKQANFEKKAGESIGSFLDKRGIYDNIEENLYKNFLQSKTNADEALATLKGNYQPEQVKTALQNLVAKFEKVSSPGATDPELSKAKALLGKIQGQGLTMSEINEAKRLYERNVKLDFLKENNVDGIRTANNVDSAIREWQFKQAEKLGLKNLPEINKETMLSKQLLDDIGKENAGSAGNNAITLTDWIMLSGGDPTSVAGFLVKKGVSSKKVQGKIAEKLSKVKEKKTVATGIFEEPTVSAVGTYKDFLKSTAGRKKQQ